MELISREAAIAAMKKATKEVGFNPFKALNELPAVEAFAAEEIEAAVKDRDALCKNKDCGCCDYYRCVGCGGISASEIYELVNTYRKRKEEGECN